MSDFLTHMTISDDLTRMKRAHALALAVSWLALSVIIAYFAVRLTSLPNTPFSLLTFEWTVSICLIALLAAVAYHLYARLTRNIEAYLTERETSFARVLYAFKLRTTSYGNEQRGRLTGCSSADLGRLAEVLSYGKIPSSEFRRPALFTGRLTKQSIERMDGARERLFPLVEIWARTALPLEPDGSTSDVDGIDELSRLGEDAGIGPMIEAYLSGVPLEDVVA